MEARISFSKNGETPFQQLLGHNKEILEKWNALSNVLSEDSLLSADLKEQIRRSLAQQNKCEYCKAKGKPDLSKLDESTSLAAAFSEVMLKTNGSPGNSTVQLLKTTFTEQQISELCAYICFAIASQWFGAALGLKP
ncbi:carboxymuconolactone decarboxylase family protein [Bacillus smithii]|uniref:carboxymuconolactone decarboxylase family protein n=1 Tax=Bacillus smithii TaxID=1479 RepID=UPI002E1B8814|nr:carboxymuconolactone decarboxylase family protein [Bacillus smithii]